MQGRGNASPDYTPDAVCYQRGEHGAWSRHVVPYYGLCSHGARSGSEQAIASSWPEKVVKDEM
jgi:hypothetical protein